jgi:crotonobetainyl-CoA:carnitine CoA-transferase CaiB-like acyl-CoA transferase
MSATPLAGLKVIELSHTVMGPAAGLVFAELGADVIKVEPAPHGDHTRALGGFAAGFFATFNRNKRSLALDLKQSRGQATLHRLVSGTDVVIENYAPGTMERFWDADTKRWLRSIRASSTLPSKGIWQALTSTGQRWTRWCSSTSGWPI